MSNLAQKIKEGISSKDGTPAYQRFEIHLLALGLVLALAVGTGGWLYYRHEHAVASKTAQDTLASIADLKVKNDRELDERTAWRHGGDARQHDGARCVVESRQP